MFRRAREAESCQRFRFFPTDRRSHTVGTPSILDSAHNRKFPPLPKAVNIAETAVVQPGQMHFGANELVGWVVLIGRPAKRGQELDMKLLRGRVDVLRVHEPPSG